MIDETSDAFFRRLAVEREARVLVEGDARALRRQHRRSMAPVDKHRLDPGGSYSLTIRGSKPSQVLLEQAPEDLLKRSGEVGYRAYLPGN